MTLCFTVQLRWAWTPSLPLPASAPRSPCISAMCRTCPFHTICPFMCAGGAAVQEDACAVP